MLINKISDHNYNNKNSFNEHNKTKHSAPTFICDNCDKKFESKDTLESHSREAESADSFGIHILF